MRGLDIEKHVRIDRLQASVYDDEEGGLKKPPLGEKLNKPAHVVYEGLDQHNKFKQKMEQDPQYLQKRR